jgi:hypothetical protein
MTKGSRRPKLPKHMQDEEPHGGKDFTDCKKWLDHARYAGLFPPQLDDKGREVGIQLLEVLLNSRDVIGTRDLGEWSEWASSYPPSAAPINKKRLPNEPDEHFYKRQKAERLELAVRTRALRLGLLSLLRLLGAPSAMRSDLSRLLREPKVPKAKARVRAQTYVIANPNAKPAEVAKSTGYKESEVSRDRQAGTLAGVARGLGRPRI